MFCPECGAKNEDTAKFCIKCGKSLNYPSEDVTTPSDQINYTKQFTISKTTSYIIAVGVVIGISFIILIYLHNKGSNPIPSTTGTSSTQSDNSQSNESDNINRLLSQFQYYYNNCDVKGMKTLFREGFDQIFMAYMKYLCARNGAPFTSTLEMTKYRVEGQSEERIECHADAYETIKAKSGVEATVESDLLIFYINKRDGYKIERVTGLRRLEDY